MLTQIVTFLIFVAVIGCILYGRRLIKTEKIDAVFGNPERALGGTHWVIVGSSFLPYRMHPTTAKKIKNVII